MKGFPVYIGPCYPRCNPAYMPHGPRVHRLLTRFPPEDEEEGGEPLSAWDHWITDRLPLNSVPGPTGSSWDHWITDRIPMRIWVGLP